MKSVQAILNQKLHQRIYSFRKALLPFLDQASPSQLLRFIQHHQLPPQEVVNSLELEKPSIQLSALLFMLKEHPMTAQMIQKKIRGWLKFKGMGVRREEIPLILRLAKWSEKDIIKLQKGTQGQKRVLSQVLFLRAQKVTDQPLQTKIFQQFFKILCLHQKYLALVELSLRSVPFQYILTRQKQLFNKFALYQKTHSAAKAYQLQTQLHSLIQAVSPLYLQNLHIVMRPPFQQAIYLSEGGTSSTVSYLRQTARRSVFEWNRVKQEYLKIQLQKRQSREMVDPFIYKQEVIRKERQLLNKNGGQGKKNKKLQIYKKVFQPSKHNLIKSSQSHFKQTINHSSPQQHDKTQSFESQGTQEFSEDQSEPEEKLMGTALMLDQERIQRYLNE